MNDKKFVEFYKRVMSGQTPSLVGTSFNAEQYADLMDLIISQMHNCYFKENGINFSNYLNWVNNEIRTRKSCRRFYQHILYEESNEKTKIMENVNEQEKIDLISLMLKMFDRKVEDYDIKLILRINDLLNKSDNPKIKDIFQITKNK
jgi:hypothetical protein